MVAVDLGEVFQSFKYLVRKKGTMQERAANFRNAANVLRWVVKQQCVSKQYAVTLLAWALEYEEAGDFLEGKLFDASDN
jgi:hypothetical protein